MILSFFMLIVMSRKLMVLVECSKVNLMVSCMLFMKNISLVSSG